MMLRRLLARPRCLARALGRHQRADSGRRRRRGPEVNQDLLEDEVLHAEVDLSGEEEHVNQTQDRGRGQIKNRGDNEDTVIRTSTASVFNRRSGPQRYPKAQAPVAATAHTVSQPTAKAPAPITARFLLAEIARPIRVHSH